jgi:hypothetical protein
MSVTMSLEAMYGVHVWRNSASPETQVLALTTQEDNGALAYSELVVD